MRVKVDLELCVGCGLCADTCSEVFELQEDKVVVRVNLVPKELEDKCRQAKDECPSEAISIEE